LLLSQTGAFTNTPSLGASSVNEPAGMAVEVDFEELADGRYANTSRSEHLRSDVPASLRNLARMYGDSAPWQAWSGLEHSVRSGEPLWRPFSAEKVKPKIGGYVKSFANVSAFVCAVQLAARGDDKNCQAIWERFAQEERWESDGFRDSFEGERKNPALLLADCLFIHFTQDPEPVGLIM
jgi:hypothetical protein